MKNLFKTFLLLSLVIITVACEPNPYPETGDGEGDGTIRGEQRRETNPPVIAMSIDLPSKDPELYEGQQFVQKIRVAVPKPGKPIVEVEGLPVGAEFDAEKLTITWKPSFIAGNDPQDPTIKVRRYFITVRLFTTEVGREAEARTRVLPLIVFDVPRKFEINAQDRKYVSEGETLTYDFDINNEDYPIGPFNIYSSDIPANAKINKISDTKYRLVYSPDFHHVKLNENAQSCLSSSWTKKCYKYIGKITAINPAGHKVEKTIEIEVKDTRQEVKLSTPSDMENGLDITFSISAIDPNGEIAPEISLDSRRPEYGEFKTHLEKDEANNFSVLHVSWTDIPTSYNGKDHSFSFKSCVLSNQSTRNACDSETFNISIKVKERKAPVFSRESWEVGNIKYLKFNERFSTYISVRDGDSFNSISKVEVLPKSMQKFIKYSGGKLAITGMEKTGIHQFTLSATSEYNVTSAESFVFEVFDKKRAKTLYFTDSTRDAEVKFYRDTMKNVELMNPVLQPLNKRNLSGRDNLIIGTGILLDIDRRDDIEKAMGLINNVVIASPLIGNMPEAFLKQLQSKFRVSITGRYSQLTAAPKLSDMYFVARGDMNRTSENIGLKLTTTEESFDPLIFSVGVNRVNCQDVLDLNDKKKESLYKIGVICDRPSPMRGRFAILGTEFADLKTVVADKDIPAQWLRRMLTMPLNLRSSK